MDWGSRKLTCKQIMQQVEPFKSMVIPSKGWLKTIRTAIGMSGKQLAERCGFTQQRLAHLENDEILRKVTISTLERVAEQMGCKLVYAIVPKIDLIDMLEKQAEKVAIDRLNIVSHSMALENQKVGDEQQKYQIELLKDEILRNNIKEIWQ